MAKKKKIWKPYISEPKPLTKIEQMMFNTDPVLSRINNTEKDKKVTISEIDIIP